MRSLRRATCTSGDPVSAVCVLYVPMTSVLRSLVNATDSSTYGPEFGPSRPLQSAVAYGDDWESRFATDSLWCNSPPREATIPIDSVFYIRTMTGCKAPPGRVSA